VVHDATQYKLSGMAMLRNVAILFLVLFAVLKTENLYAAGTVEEQTRGVIRGKITDSTTGEPVGWTSILVVESGRSTTAHENGEYIIPNVVPGTVTIRTHRVGYESVSRQVSVTPGDTITLNIRLRQSSFISRAIEVIGERDNGDALQVERRVDGRELRQQLGRTLAETLQNEPGMTQSTMGPAPARPVLRGLSGDRLLVLEDGRTTGDISSSSPDHALAIDPINSNHIEILRGPAALVYSSNSLAGVVNVVRGQIPTELPAHFHGTGSIQGETVNRGISAGFSTYGSIKNYGLRADLGVRSASDINTPEGKLDNTKIQNYHGAIGVSRIKSWGLMGASANFYRSSYGIPGDFIGSHPEGVKINLEREQVDLKFDINPDMDWIRRVLFDYTFSHYFHEELEFDPFSDAFTLVGSDYSLFTNSLRGKFYHDGSGALDSGIFGFNAESSNFASGGLTFTPETNQYSAATFAYQQFEFGRLSLQTGLRFDFLSVQPLRPQVTSIGLRRQRDFYNVSGGFKSTYAINTPLSTGFSIMRTVRMPGVEELFTEGPHLPAYSFEVGNPDLNEEVGLGFDWNIRYATGRFGFQNSWYLNNFTNYLYPRNTGEMSARRPLPVYQFSGDSVRMWGTELLVEIKLSTALSLNTTLSYVEGTLTESGNPLPFIPPLSGKTDLQYTSGALTLGGVVRFAADQNRLGEFEDPTDRYTVFDAFGQYYLSTGKQLHTLSLTIENVTNTTYRMHLSRVKSIMPEPGRNIKLLYKVYF
jgi:iron complex outermembrane receptor protein